MEPGTAPAQVSDGDLVQLLNALTVIKLKKSTLGSLTIGQLKGLVRQGVIDVNSLGSCKPDNLAKAGLTPEQQDDLMAAMASVQDMESVIQAERRLTVAEVLELMCELDADLGDNAQDKALKKSLHALKGELEAWESQQ